MKKRPAQSTGNGWLVGCLLAQPTRMDGDQAGRECSYLSLYKQITTYEYEDHCLLMRRHSGEAPPVLLC